MIATLVIALVYLAQLVAKTLLATAYARRARATVSIPTEGEVSIVQPILGGDPKLRETLEANLRTIPNANFIWLVDEDDSRGNEVCERLAAGHSVRSIFIVRCEPQAQGVNPKAHKLALALPYIRTPVFVVLDDDTRLTPAGLRALTAALANGATLATGLPRYRAGQGRFSGWLAEFVNSAAVLTYLPALAFAEPISIHGMCYAMRTIDARRLDVFRSIRYALTDDLALALELRRQGLRVWQTVEPHDIATSVSSLATLGRILHRWFVFTRLLITECPWRTRAVIGTCYAIPPLLLIALFAFGFQTKETAGVFLLTLGARDLNLRFIKRRFLGRGILHLPFASIILEIAQPVLLATAYFRTTIQWRTRTIRVHSVSRFEYV